jgi:hypothetical protein
MYDVTAGKPGRRLRAAQAVTLKAEGVGNGSRLLLRCPPWRAPEVSSATAPAGAPTDAPEVLAARALGTRLMLGLWLLALAVYLSNHSISSSIAGVGSSIAGIQHTLQQLVTAVTHPATLASALAVVAAVAKSVLHALF